LSEISTSSSSSVILDSCPTKIFLPNPEARNPAAARLYSELGLTQKQQELIALSEPKRHYYYVSPLGKRLFELELGEVAKRFCAVSDPESLEEFRELREEYPKDYLHRWLKD